MEKAWAVREPKPPRFLSSTKRRADWWPLTPSPWRPDLAIVHFVPLPRLIFVCHVDGDLFAPPRVCFAAAGVQSTLRPSWRPSNFQPLEKGDAFNRVELKVSILRSRGSWIKVCPASVPAPICAIATVGKSLSCIQHEKLQWGRPLQSIPNKA